MPDWHRFGIFLTGNQCNQQQLANSDKFPRHILHTLTSSSLSASLGCSQHSSHYSHRYTQHARL
jgi:hypothetical protein